MPEAEDPTRGISRSTRSGYVPVMDATPVVHVDDERFRVTEWRFAPGASTGWHRHEHDYVVVPLVTGQLRIVSSAGEQLIDLTAGQSYTRRTGVEHDVHNPNDFPFAFVEIERID